ncbi:MAG: hypothetical protein PHD61_13390 [Bacteroidales bacterium]|nr:hypothetical protein [Bacteroidales bacterium]
MKKRIITDAQKQPEFKILPPASEQIPLLRTFLRTPIKKPLIVKGLTEKMRCGREYQIVSQHI